MYIINSTKSMTFRSHLAISVAIRLILIVYGQIHDEYSEVSFTDIDYKVVTDGARHIVEGGSPFERHTYRYTPLLAYFLLPNIFLHRSFGKILFSLFDILIGVLIRKIIFDEFQSTFLQNAASILKKQHRFDKRKSKAATPIVTLPPKYEQIATWSSLFWLYNPLSIVIATRGNGDSITSFFILLTICAIQKAVTNKSGASYVYTLLAGIVHGVAIHFRLYPLAFSFAYFVYLGSNVGGSAAKQQSMWKSILQPNPQQMLLVFSTITSLLGLTLYFYRFYGQTFLYEAYIYHLVRKDTRHNFSLFFYMNYLNVDPIAIEKVLTFLPQMILILMVSVQYGRHRKTMSFCIFLLSFIMVTFNPVVTSQYFVWFLAILPICLKNLHVKGFGVRRSIAYVILWAGVQGIWLFSAYLLEFKGWNTFGFIWMQGAIFFCVNCFILKELIVNFDVIANFSKE